MNQEIEPISDPCWRERVAGLVHATRWPATPAEALEAGQRIGHKSPMVRMILAAAEESHALWFNDGRWCLRQVGPVNAQ